MERRAPPPSWINKEFVEDIFEKKKHAKVIIDDIDVEYACVEGTGYGSLLFRIVASFKEESSEELKKETILAKVALDGGPLKEMLDKCNAFRTESVFLHEVIPQIHEILASLEGDEFRPLTADCYYWGQQPKEFLVLQDLSVAGFRMAEGGKPLDYNHCRLVMRAYGRLHAASVKLLKDQRHYKDVFSNSIYTNKCVLDYFQTISQRIFIALADELEKCPGFQKYSEKYRSLTNLFVNSSFQAFENVKSTSKLCVIAHGDCWKNNMMYKYMDGRAIEVRLVDLQMANINSPASDLVYFLFANAGEEVHRHHLDSLLEEYHTTLQTTLQKLGLELEADTYTLEELRLDMERFTPSCVMFSAISGFVLTSEKYGAEFSKAFNDPEHFDEAVTKMFDNPYTLPYMKYLIPIFDSKGALDSSYFGDVK